MYDSYNPYAELYANPKGPGDTRPTALQIVRDNDLSNKWTDIVVLVTGAASGLGIEAARALHATGADVFITARDTTKAQGVIDDIKKSSQGSGKLEVVEVNMNSFDSVKKAARVFLAKSSKLNILINNAGIMATPEGSKTSDRFEQQFGVNHLAHFILTTLLLPILISSSTLSFNSRIISLTSNGHRYSAINWDDVNFTKGYNPWISYGQSKTANILMANYINRVYGSHGVYANSVHPGGALTGLQVNLSLENLQEWGSNAEMMAGMLSPEQGAARTVWAAVSSTWEGNGGKYLTDCGVGAPAKDMMSILDPGYAPHAFDEEGENRLWKLSEELTNAMVTK